MSGIGNNEVWEKGDKGGCMVIYDEIWWTLVDVWG
jgi:hypothetical protein